MKRREFVILTCATLVGCANNADTNSAPVFKSVSIDAGPAADYQAEGVYDRFRDRGFFIVRRGGKLIALSAICTHRHCALRAEPDRSFYCKCHGSAFDPDGKVIEGPAVRDLPVLQSEIDVRGRLIIKNIVM